MSAGIPILLATKPKIVPGLQQLVLESHKLSSSIDSDVVEEATCSAHFILARGTT